MRDFEPSYDTVMRGIATFAGRCAVEALIPRLSVFFYSFNALERLPKLATSSLAPIDFVSNGYNETKIGKGLAIVRSRVRVS